MTRGALIYRLLLIAAACCVAGCDEATVESGSGTSGESPRAAVTVFFDDFAGTTVDPAKWTVFDRLSDQANRK